MSSRLITFVCATALTVQGQEFSQRGFMAVSGDIYPQLTENDMAHGIGTGRARYEPEWRPTHWFTLLASLEAQIDTHRQVARDLHLDWYDRSLERPVFSFRQLAAVLKRNHLSLTLGKQFIRWGEADFLNPTDRFVPKDLLNPVDPEFLAVTAARLTYIRGNNTFDVVWQPGFTPARIPLMNQRWTFLPDTFNQFVVQDLGSVFPSRSSFGARWNHTGAGYEYSFSYYEGFNSLPTFDEHINSASSTVTFSRMYPALRLYGVDFAIPLTSFAVKGEAAYYTSPGAQQDDYLLYVLEVEKQLKDLRITIGYAGEVVTAHSEALQYSAEEGFARAAIAHAQYVLDPNRTLTLDVFVRQDGRSSLLQPGYAQSFGGHWSATMSYVWLRGEENDFLGQYHRNSFAKAELRYSF